MPAGLCTLGDDDVRAHINRFHRLRDGLYLGDSAAPASLIAATKGRASPKENMAAAGL